MKTLSLIVVLSIAFACQQQTAPRVDADAAKAEVSALMDKLQASIINKDASAYIALLASEGVFAGTDPGEVFSKAEISEYMTKVFADSALVIKPYKIDKREIRIDDDGRCAYILDQFVLTAISPNIPLRFTAHAVEQEGKWLLDFSALSMIPRNEDVIAINGVAKH